MYYAAKDGQGPHIVLLQALLRLHGYSLTISGYWQQKTDEAVMDFRQSIGLAKVGPVNGPVMAQLLQGKRIKMIEAIDAEAGKILPYSLKAFKDAGVKPVMNEKRVGHGVEDAMSRIAKRAKDHRIGCLRISGHGNRGAWISVALGDPVTAKTEGRWDEYDAMEADWPSYIDYAHLDKLKPILKQITPYFAPFGYVEAHSCRIGIQTKLMEGLANIWGVPVSGGTVQSPAGETTDKWGNKVPLAFVLTGPINRGYADQMNLAKWAAKVDQLIPNFPGMANKVKNAVVERVTGR